MNINLLIMSIYKLKINKHTFYLLFLILGFLFFPLFLVSKADSTQINYLPGEMLVRLKNQEKIYKIKYPDLPEMKEIQKILLERQEIEYAEPNYIFHLSFLPDDRYLNEQWYLNKIKAPQAWDLTKGGGEDVTVAVLDSGVWLDHPDLKNNIWTNKGEIPGDGIDNDQNGYIDDINGWDFTRWLSDPRPKFDESYTPSGIHHGTIIAGIIAAQGNNRDGIAGLTWRSKIMPLRVLNSDGTGSLENVIQGVNYAVKNKAQIINLSFVGTNDSYFLKETLKEAWRAGLIIVAAAGNEGNSPPSDLDKDPVYPICLDKDDPDNFIIGVAATDQNDFKTAFSNYGKGCVDIAAPGSHLYGLMVYNSSLKDYQEYYGGYWSGTSVAAPMVSGAAALIKGINPLASNRQIRDILLDQSDEIDSLNPDYAGKLGRGRLNVYRAADFAYSQLANLPQNRYIVTGAGRGGGPHVRVFKSNGLPVSGFFAYDPKFRGGVQVATGDVDGDGEEEIITSPGPGGGPHIRVFNINGELKYQFFAWQETLRGGINLAAADLDQDGLAEIIIGLGSEARPEVYVFDYQGQEKFHFLAYAQTFRGGVQVATGDVDGDGKKEIITSPGPGGGPHVRIFDNRGNFKYHFFAFLQSFRGGIKVAAADLDQDKKDEILVGITSQASPYLRVFTWPNFLTRQFLAYDRDFYGGVNLTSADLNDDQLAEIITGPISNGGPQVRVFDSDGNPVSQFFAYTKNFRGGINLTTIRAK